MKTPDNFIGAGAIGILSGAGVRQY